MQVCHSFSPIPKSIFLAGPTPRSVDVKSWRPEAIQHLLHLGFQGTVYVPEHDDWAANGDYNDQVHWEWEATNTATVVAFWIPRDLVTMPAMITNIEYGLFANSGKIILGFPPESPKNRYLNKLASRYQVLVKHTLFDTMNAAMKKANGVFGDNRTTSDHE